MSKFKHIIVPKDKQAEIDLDYDKADDSALITWTISQSEYEDLDQLEIFDTINNLCNSLIDEYEDAKISSEKLEKVSNYLDGYSNTNVVKLNSLIKEAIERNTSIWFYF